MESLDEIKHLDFKQFNNVKEVYSHMLGQVYQAGPFMLKSFYNLDKITTKEIVHEV